MQGNYFKKRVIINAQGQSSLVYVKKNAAIDICNDEWIGDDTAKVRFGDWVPQDSFHLKAYYTDFFRGISVVSYKLYEQIVKTRGNVYDKPWKKALINMGMIEASTKSLGNPLVGQIDLQTDTGALCHPDGFPTALYLNGEFYGIFSWQLKKHRDNYHLSKSTAEHVHLDGTITSGLFIPSSIKWNYFEIRNPKNLYAIGGNKYDADIKQEEIAGEDEVNAWIAAGALPDGTKIDSKITKNLQMTAKVKKYIINLGSAIANIKQAESVYNSSSKNDEDLTAFKNVIEQYFDLDSIIDYVIFSDLVFNSDGFDKNWQWITYDGKKWSVCVYDLDMSFGAFFLGDRILSHYASHINTSMNAPHGYIIKYYDNELEERYKAIADAGLIDKQHIFNLVKDWTIRIGTSFYKEEYDKWKDSPCISDSIIRDLYWEAVKDDSGNYETDSKETFDATKSYKIGDIVSFGISSSMGYFKFKCKQQTIALSKNTPHEVSAYSPISVFKHNDSLYRIQKWIEQSVSDMDKIYKYKRN